MKAQTEQDANLISVDVAIVGGAMAGATLALGLKGLSDSLKRPLKIALIEAHHPNQDHPGFDARSIAIAHGSIFELTRLGLWPKLAHLGTPIDNIHISDRGHMGMTELNAEAFNLHHLGQVVELERVGQVLFKLLSEADISLYCPNKLASVEAKVDAQLLTLDDGTRLRTSLLVAADGVNSQVRAAFKQPLKQVDFDQVALVANIELAQVEIDKTNESWAYERFTQHGPLALLPMSPVKGIQRKSLVWALSPDEALRLLCVTKDQFLDELQQAFGSRAGQFTAVGERYSYPLMLSYMPKPIYHRTVFIGNAAQTLHPIAGQGFNLGLRDLVSLIQVIEQTLLDETDTEPADFGSTQVTYGYLHSRESDRNNTIRNIEFLVRGFSNDYWPLVVGRNLGLRMLSWLPPLKTPVARIAMGWKAIS
ncbi:2-octaprenyl-6-methoxyphenyl hydroxylase [Shewanella sp. D64]|uniref:2-octaprenyl-6-methoxyphenyl hydroxylase n=1 Tax=unclassified Shewanella TaxID=196818 RepID=UPI0022BA25B6|nr:MULTISPECIES: 2-octaprenyl-6-methoxyphenyl hydroxylase [unclassified Shewanella]MEC4725030.1 2-octaprenyl-6-methoxyphenyl hydroxylase [Shewanella sp. D64]MEC4736931.1 2-octaprenyl-6-methoxyphenyl hydroxylase [Shewanella sp. E94]WBJ96526.1 2-octaprenyl-6-methoxyphenyl hydroxylase [Shewanella sp. MTB7]